MEEVVPYTERSNDITKSIDVANADQIFEIIHSCNGETFTGNSDPFCNGILDKTCVQQCALVSEAIASNIFNKPGSNRVVLSGCGTSGRIGFMVVRAFNKILDRLSLPRYYEYMIAGDDRSLFISQEAKEDQWNVGFSELAAVTKDFSRVAYFGITCGLSAPYVAGQLENCLNSEKDKFIPVILGFNPVELARKNTLVGLGKSFSDITREILEGCHGYIINPIVGAEPITGSSRMKGGTATKIILEAIFLTAHIKSGHLAPNFFHKSYIEIIEFLFEKIYFQAYQQFSTYKTEIIPILESCGDSLNKKTSLNEEGHIYYVADGVFGLLGLIDASECPPTFGTDYSTVKGFLYGAYDTLCNSEGDLESKFGDFYSISWSNFEALIPNLHSFDTVILLACEMENFAYTKQIVDQVKKSPCRLFGIVKEMPGNKLCQDLIDLIDNCVVIRHSNVPISSSDILDFPGIDFYEEMMLKWILNTITTGAHILHGKIVENYMIDVQPTNSKLFNRSIDIVGRFSGTSTEKSTSALLSAIYQADDPSPFLSADVNEHVMKAVGVKRVVPTAILIASRDLTVSNAIKYLEANPVIRNAIHLEQ